MVAFAALGYVLLAAGFYAWAVRTAVQVSESPRPVLRVVEGGAVASRSDANLRRAA